jgi:hypothetical protein
MAELRVKPGAPIAPVTYIDVSKSETDRSAAEKLRVRCGDVLATRHDDRAGSPQCAVTE